MKLYEKIFKIKFLIIFSLLFSISVKADNHNIYETLELIKKDLKTLERAVYSGSNETNNDFNSSQILSDVLTRHLLKLKLKVNFKLSQTSLRK